MERPIPPQNLKSWKNEVSQPLAPREGGDAARDRRGAAYLGAEGGASAALPPPPPTFWQGLGPFRPASALLGSRPPPPLALSPSHPLSLPPARDGPRAPAGEFAVAGCARPERSGSPGQPSSPPRALSHLNFSEVRKGLPGTPARDSCTSPVLRWTHFSACSSRLGRSMPRPGMEASVAREHEPAPAERSRGELGTQVAAARVSRCAVAHRDGTGERGGWRGWGSPLSAFPGSGIRGARRR